MACWQRGYSDAKVAARVNRRLALQGAPADWTKRRVQLWRHRQGLAPHPCRGAELLQALETRRRVYALRRGFEHLLPGPRERHVSRNDRVITQVKGYNLRPREIDVLCLLRDMGPLTRLQMQRLLGLRSKPHAGNVDTFRRLCVLGLVAVRPRRQRGARRVYVYSLTPAALPPDKGGIGG